jgi:hypothetical protein
MIPGKHHQEYQPPFHVLLVMLLVAIAFALMFQKDILPAVNASILLLVLTYFLVRVPISLLHRQRRAGHADACDAFFDRRYIFHRTSGRTTQVLLEAIPRYLGPQHPPRQRAARAPGIWNFSRAPVQPVPETRDR